MTLGCVSKHSAYVYDRGGITRVAELLDLEWIRWGRLRDDISEASLRISGAPCSEQAELLSTLRSSRHELVIFRGDERVWEGPITRLAGTRNSFEVYARDVMHYTTRTTMRAGYSNAYPNTAFVIDRAAAIMNTELARKEALDPPINVLPYLTLHQLPTDARTSAVTKPRQYQVFEHIDSLAARNGLDYTVLGRAVHFWDTHESLGQTATLTEADFLGDITVTEYGSELATIVHVTDGEGNYGTAGTADPYYGEVELLYTAGDETEGAAPPTNAEMQSQAVRNLAGRNPTPIQLRIPDNSSLDPAGVLSMADLVPGVWMPVRADVVGFSLQQMQKLNAMKVEETGSGETITVVLYPASIADTEEEGA